MADLLARLHSALVDRYAIERELGAGGMATVYLAQDLKHQRQVAVVAAGGWRDTQTLLDSYQQVDVETVRQVVLHPTQPIVSH